jgi:hypothetical protein
MSTEKFMKWASALGSLSTVAATLLGFYVYFLTDIPEDLIKKLNSEVAVLNEQAVDLRIEKRNIEFKVQELLQRLEITKTEANNNISKYNREIEQLTESISSLQKEKSFLENERQDISNMLSNAQSDMRKISQEKHKAFVELASQRVSIAISENVRPSIWELIAEGQQTKDLELYIAWDAEYAALNRSDQSSPEYFDKKRHIFDQFPRSWFSWAIDLTDIFKLDPYRGAPEFRVLLADTTRKQSGIDFLGSALLENFEYVNFSETDNNRVKKAISGVLEQNSELLVLCLVCIHDIFLSIPYRDTEPRHFLCLIRACFIILRHNIQRV